MKLWLLMLLLLLCGAPLTVWSHEQVVDEEQLTVTGPLVYTLNPVVVRAYTLEPGQTTVDGAELEMLPSATGSITEALKGMSQIQYDYERQSSLTAGEIAPPRISISGAKPYENNFMIDGMSVSNTLNPSGLNDIRAATQLAVGGGDNTIFYDTSLIGSVQVYSSNVSARYGGFVGGVVDATLRNPAVDRWRFVVSGRYTEDSLFDMRNVDEESREPNNQPRFSIYRAGFSADGPLNDYAALLISYARHQSSIPLSRITPDSTIFTDKQQRTSENYFARLNLRPHSELTVNVDLTYAPYSELRWDSSFRDSEWYVENRSWRFAAQADYLLSAGLLTSKFFLAQHGFSRDSKTNFRYSDPDDRYGGLGDTKNKTREVGVSVDFESTDQPMDSGYLNYAAGVQYGYKHTDMWNEGIEIYSLTATRKTIQTYEEISQSSHNSNVGGYGQIEAVWKRLLVRPGVRVDYDRFTGNTDIAPRFKTEYDVFGNSTMRIDAGANRYYGRQLSAYAFRRHRPVNTQVYDIQPDGTEVPRSPTVGAGRSYSSDGLSTPYSDELVGGVSGFVYGFDYRFHVMQRKHRKQLISKSDDGSHYYLTNDGNSEYREISFLIGRDIRLGQFGHHRMMLSATKSKSNSSNDYYDSDVRSTRILGGYDFYYSHVFYNGEYIIRSDMPAENYNSPWVLTLSTNSNFLNNQLRLYTVTRWRGSSRGIIADRTDDTPYGTVTGGTSNLWINPDGGYSNAYKSGKISGGSTTDITAEFDAIKTERYHLTMILEVLNIFNGNMQTGIAEDAPGIHGRGFYLGARMTF